jgi:Na+-driven multidrug efflux pump
LNKTEVAVWGLVGEIWEVAEDLVLAFSDASEVRVAHLLGLGRPREAKESSDKSMFLGVFSGGLMSALLSLIHTHIPRWVTNDGIIERMLRNLMPIVCLGIALLSYGSMSWSILCAQGRTPLATAVTCFGSLFITLPLASLSTFYFNYNLKALAGCLILGYCTSGFFNSLLMLTSDWEKISKKVKERTKLMEENMKNDAIVSMTEKDCVPVNPKGGN